MLCIIDITHGFCYCS
ncbi:CRISPR-associated DxTHG motif protein [Emticicia agri]|uniref:CRISPR-associated DxTHG motif protein n=1 Tax=Emticicia agri TaxID=2492393 RepID=A0A4Q5LVB8_9BACT|nr:CRISPR-associated DxTHG motif protein [Emticicia agri]